MLQQWESVQAYNFHRAKEAYRRRSGEERRKKVEACVRAIMERRSGEDRREV